MDVEGVFVFPAVEKGPEFQNEEGADVADADLMGPQDSIQVHGLDGDRSR